MSMCPQCGGLRMQPGIAYGYAGPICCCRGYYRDMELVYKPTMDRLRDDMQRIKEIAESHEWPTAAAKCPHCGQSMRPTDLEDIRTALQTEVQAKSPHESSLQDVYDRVDLTYERKGD